MDFITIHEISQIADYSNPTATDTDQLFLCTNLWCNLIADLTEEFYGHQLARLLKRYRFARCVELADQTALLLLKGESFTGQIMWFREAIATLDLKDAVQFLRFPKRFTYRDNPTLKQDTLDAFLQRNRAAKTQICLPYWLALRFHQIRDRIFKKIPVIRHGERRVPTGVPAWRDWAKSSPTVGQRIVRYMQTYQFAVPNNPYYHPIEDRYKQVAVEYFDKITRRSPSYYDLKRTAHTYCEVTIVPKNYKTMRTIASEEIDRQVEEGFFQDWYYDTVVARSDDPDYGPKGRITPLSQERNRDFCRISSIDNSHATVDLSAASDSIRAEVLVHMLPEHAMNFLIDHRSNYIRYEQNGRIVEARMGMYLTMGSRMTFPTEIHVFWMCCCVSRDLYYDYTGVWYDMDEFAVFGDDIVCPTDVYATLVDILGMVGFTVNNEKSCFEPNNYRESCGLEAWNGEDVSPKYWPRAVVSSKNTEGLIQLIELQHRMVHFDSVTEFLTNYLFGKKPSLTQTMIGTRTQSIWHKAPFLLMRDKVFPNRTYTETKVTLVKNVYIDERNKYTEREREIIDMYDYFYFLEHGPFYEDPLLELLGVSTPRQRSTVTSKAKLVNSFQIL